MHISLLVSGSHSPFSMHVAESGPSLSTSPGGQLKVTVLPSTGISNPTMFGTESLLNLHVDGSKSGRPQLTIYSNNYIAISLRFECGIPLILLYPTIK